MTDDFDPLTTLDRAILAAASFGGGFSIGFAPDAGGWIRGEGVVFRGVNVTPNIERLMRSSHTTKEAREFLKKQYRKLHNDNWS